MATRRRRHRRESHPPTRSRSGLPISSWRHHQVKSVSTGKDWIAAEGRELGQHLRPDESRDWAKQRDKCVVVSYDGETERRRSLVNLVELWGRRHSSTRSCWERDDRTNTFSEKQRK